MFKKLVGNDERVSMLESYRDCEIFLHTLAIAHLKVGGNGVIPDEVDKFIESCYLNGIRFKVSLVKEADDYETGNRDL